MVAAAWSVINAIGILDSSIQHRIYRIPVDEYM